MTIFLYRANLGLFFDFPVLAAVQVHFCMVVSYLRNYQCVPSVGRRASFCHASRYRVLCRDMKSWLLLAVSGHFLPQTFPLLISYTIGLH